MQTGFHRACERVKSTLAPKQSSRRLPVAPIAPGIQKLLGEVFREKSKQLMPQCLLPGPVLGSIPRAELLLDYILNLQKDYLIKFHQEETRWPKKSATRGRSSNEHV